MELTKLLACFILAIGVQALEVTQLPACVSACWDNSQYVSSCSQQTSCLCDDADFQSVVLQCLYSQCQTTQFGAALHRTLAICSNSESDALGALPQLIRHKGLRKRQGPKNTESAFVTRSAFVIQSATQPAIGRLTVASTTGGMGPTATGHVSDSRGSANATTFNSTFHLQATNGAARLRIGR